MRERPILFSAPMVRAILAGQKTQTRRVVKGTSGRPVEFMGSGGKDGADWNDPDAWGYECHDENRIYTLARDHRYGDASAYPCPYGQPGDRLWVRESHWWFKDEHDPVTGYFPPKLTIEDVEYRADGDDGRKVWRQSIHMPRWASRITLEITGVRVERLQDISEADAMAEGIRLLNGRYTFNDGMHESRTARDSYRALWEIINGPRSWDTNAWLWVVEFKRDSKEGAA